MIDRGVAGIDGRVMIALILVATSSVVTEEVKAQEAEGSDPWWVEFQLGYGSTELISDLGRGGNRGAATIASRGGRAFGERFRMGLEIGGWLLESGDIWDPSEGESLSDIALIAQLTPFTDLPLFAEAGAGLTMYTNNQPLEFGSWGAGWTVGAGWPFIISRTFRFVPTVHASVGFLRDIDNALTTETGLGYTAFDLRLGLMKEFGLARD